jgi:hypothetical protein
MKAKEARQIIDNKFYTLKKEDRSQYDTLVSLLVKYGTDESRPLGKLVIPKTADVGITVRPERPEDMPKTITVITEDFIRLITIAGSLCHPKAPSIYKQRMDGELRKIAVRHHINYVGEIKENDSRFPV